ncbi:hypothetical protein [Chitinophaga nivalis]|uniref:Uncharacterized protein n=1 Tax=Chitinophaga nivalis TaxID=2991709 RepID=A0ABT3IIM5_9BACT|nr:hypothetical protein [Chitinophaga nivalis]MCW3466492.1 hypothetical protein [Chitinophaga nivalis]MCW3483817.1 hypothetical protein [Chitinophaga nivalis]
MKRLLILVLLFIHVVTFGQSEPPSQVFYGRLYEFKTALRIDSLLLMPRGDTINIRPSLLAPGAMLYRIQDSSYYGYNGKYWKKLTIGISAAIDSAVYIPNTAVLQYRYTNGTYLAVPTGLVDSLSRRVDSAFLRNDTLFLRRLAGNVPVKITGIPIANITGLTDSLLNKPTLAAADARYAFRTRTLNVAAGAGISVTGGVQNLANNVSWTVTNTGILNQTAVEEAKDFRISGIGYIGALKLGYPLLMTTSAHPKLFISSNAIDAQLARIVQYNNNNDAALDSLGGFIFTRSNNNVVSFTDTTNQYGYVRNGLLLGSIGFAGVNLGASVLAGRPSFGIQMARIISRAESNFTDNVASSGNLSFWTKGSGDAIMSQRMIVTSLGNVGIGAGTPNSTLHVQGSVAFPIRTTNANRTLDGTDYFVNVNNTSNVVITLPTAVGIAGRAYVVKKTTNNANTVTFNTTAGQTIDGSASGVLSLPGNNYGYGIYSDGANWSIKQWYAPPSTFNVTTQAVNTPWQPSTQRLTRVFYNIEITANAIISLGSIGQVFLEISPDGSTGWTSISSGREGVNTGIAITTASTVSLSGIVPRGYYARIRTNNVVGTPTYSSATGFEEYFN